jgi:hypothetical protein
MPSPTSAICISCSVCDASSPITNSWLQLTLVRHIERDGLTHSDGDLFPLEAHPPVMRQVTRRMECLRLSTPAQSAHARRHGEAKEACESKDAANGKQGSKSRSSRTRALHL